MSGLPDRVRPLGKPDIFLLLNARIVRTSRFLHFRIAALAVVVIFRQRIQKSDKRIDVALTERHVLKLRRRISEQSLPCQLRHVDVEVDDVTEGQLAAVVEVGLGVGKITKSRRLELSDRVRQPLIDSAIVAQRTNHFLQIRLRVRHVGIQIDIPQTQVGVLGMTGNRFATKAFAGIRVSGGGRQILVEVLIPGGEIGNLDLREGTSTVYRIVFFLRGSGVVELEVGKIRRLMTSRAIAGVLRAIGSSLLPP